MTPPASRYRLWGDRQQLQTLTVLIALGGILAGGISLQRRDWLGTALPVDLDRVAAASERIDPNTASAASLQRLPGVGPVLAEHIVAYRRAHRPVAFRAVEDLTAVRRIGPGTIRRIAPYLSLPADASDSQPSGRSL